MVSKGQRPTHVGQSIRLQKQMMYKAALRQLQMKLDFGVPSHPHTGFNKESVPL